MDIRYDKRLPDMLRNVEIIPDFTKTSGGSVLIKWGNTHVLCTALLDDATAGFLEGTGKGWLTAEYSMLPSSTPSRKKREVLKPDSRSTEIKRLIGRCLRHAVDMEILGEKTVWIDCDVLQADGGTRTASITGAYVALCLGVKKWISEGRLEKNPVIHSVSAVSVGICEGTPLLDLCYKEDSSAEVDMNVCMDEEGSFIEIQGTGEGRAFSKDELSSLLELAELGNKQLMDLQKHILK